jgi:hypothetical protein
MRRRRQAKKNAAAAKAAQQQQQQAVPHTSSGPPSSSTSLGAASAGAGDSRAPSGLDLDRAGSTSRQRGPRGGAFAAALQDAATLLSVSQARPGAGGGPSDQASASRLGSSRLSAFAQYSDAAFRSDAGGAAPARPKPSAAAQPGAAQQRRASGQLEATAQQQQHAQKQQLRRRGSAESPQHYTTSSGSAVPTPETSLLERAADDASWHSAGEATSREDETDTLRAELEAAAGLTRGGARARAPKREALEEAKLGAPARRRSRTASLPEELHAEEAAGMRLSCVAVHGGFALVPWRM